MQQSVLRLLPKSLQLKNCFNNRLIHTTRIANMPIKVGDKLPSVDLFEGTPGGKVNIGELASGKKIVIFGVPGAFTPGCSKTHLPGYIADANSIRAKGVAEIVCVSVNDPFVMAAWGDANKAGPANVRMLADTTGAFTKAIDVALDMTPVLGGVRSKRYSMVVDNGVVKAVEVEPDGTGLTCSLSNNILKSL